MTATTKKQMETPGSSLNVKEQLEATANRFWTSVTMKSKCSDDSLVDDNVVGDDASKVLGVNFCNPTGSKGVDKTKPGQQSSLQFVFNSMFASCTSGANNFDTDSIDGAPSLLKHASRSNVVSITPTSSRGETSVTGSVTPSPLHQKQRPTSAVKSAIQESSKNIFRDDRDIAKEAIHRLRQQHQLDHAEKIVNDSFHDSDLLLDTDADGSLLSKNASLLSGNPSTLSAGPSTLSNNRTVSSRNQRTVSSSIINRAGTISSSIHNRTVSSSMHNRTISSGIQESGQVKLQQSSRKSSLHKFISPRLNKKNANAKTEAGKAHVRSRQEHSFFPASKPNKESSGKKSKDSRKSKLKRNKGVPKEVTPKTPTRMLKNRNTQRQKQILNGSANNDKFFADFDKFTENRDADESWDIENDGISDITQATVDRMVFAIAQHIRVFPEEAKNLNRIHSDVTDPAPSPKRGDGTGDNIVSTEPQFFPVEGGNVAGFPSIVTPPRGGFSPRKKGFSSPVWGRNVGSMGTRSFFTKTTQSTQTNDFANAWKIDEQKFWDTEVAKESQKNNPLKTKTFNKKDAMTPSRMVIKKPIRGGATSTYTSTTTATTPSTSFSSQFPHKDNNNNDVSQEMFPTNPKLMDNVVLPNNSEMAEI